MVRWRAFVVGCVDSMLECCIHQVLDQVEDKEAVEDDGENFAVVALDMAELAEEPLLVKDHMNEVSMYDQENEEGDSL